MMDVEKFLDLVSNPEKYKKYLDEVKAEENRLMAAIATVGEASQIKRLLKEAEQNAEKSRSLEDEANQRIAVLEQKTLQRQEAKQKQLDSFSNELNEKEQILKVQLEKQQKEQNALNALVAKLKSKEESLNQQEVMLNSLQKELNDKVAKLKAIGF